MEKQQKIHRAWIMAAAGTIIFICNAGMCNNVLPTYLPFLKDIGYTGTQTSFLITLRCGLSFVGTMVAPPLYKKISLKAGVVGGSLLVCLAYVLMALAKSYALLILAAVLLGFCYGACGIMPVSILMTNWFRKKRSTGQAIAAAGSGVSALVFPGLITAIVAKKSLTVSFFTTAAIAALIALCSLILIHDRPEDVGLTPYGDGEAAEEKKKKVLKGRDLPVSINRFFIISVFLLGAASMACYSHKAILFTTTGHLKSLVAVATSVSGASLIVGKIVYGSLADRFGSKKANIFSLSIILVSTLLCALSTGSNLLMFAGVFTSGFGFPPCSVGIAIWAGDFGSPEKYAGNLRNYQMAYSLGGFAFSTFPGTVYDKCGSYIPAYYIITGMFALFFAILLYVYRVSERNEAKQENA